jgi:hypothetical protein
MVTVSRCAFTTARKEFANCGGQVYVEATVAFPLIVSATFARPEGNLESPDLVNGCQGLADSEHHSRLS